MGDIASSFVDARRRNRVLAEYPGALPATLDEAYALQKRAIQLDGRTVLGWKVGRIGPPLDTELGTNRLAGPSFVVSEAGGKQVALAALDGFAAIEGEIMIALTANAVDAVMSGNPRDAVADVRLGLELATSPFVGINDFGPAVTVSDFGNNGCLLLGPSLDKTDLDATFATPMTVTIDGVVAGTARPIDILDGPLGSVTFLVRHLIAHDIAVPAGLWVSCGAVTGVHRIAVGSRADATMGGVSVACSIARQAPSTEQGDDA